MNTHSIADSLASCRELHFDSTNAVVNFDGHCTRLDHKTFQLLCYFVAHQNQVIERKTIINNLWQNQPASDASLGRLISVLRKILSIHGHQFIFTIHKTGYRFTIPKDVDLIETPEAATPPEPVIQQSSTNAGPVVLDEIIKQSSHYRSWLLMMGLSLFFGCIIWLYTTSSNAQLASDPANQIIQSRSQDRIVVLPFDLLPQQPERNLFVEGLTTELINSLTKINGLMVIDHHRSYKYLSNPLELEKLASELEVRYLLRGNIHTENNKLRVAVQLIDSLNSSIMFSTVYERQMHDSFAIQKDIALEVAAALRLTLHHPQQDGAYSYSSALTRLDHVSVEKLVVARAQINRYSKEPVNQAIKNLNELNQAYPRTPEILGLLAYANAVSISVSSFKPGYSRTTERDLALQALNLDKSNLDALTTLYYYYHDLAEFQGQARQLAQDAVNFYPGSKDTHKINFSQQVRNAGSCQQLQLAVDQLPLGVYSPKRLKALKTAISSCVGQGVLRSDDSKMQEMLNRVVNDFRLQQDGRYLASENFALKNPNQRFLSQLYCQQLMMGADQIAAANRQRLGDMSLGYWQFFTQLCSYAHDKNTSQLPSHFLDFNSNAFNNNVELVLAIGLVKQLTQDDGDIEVAMLAKLLNKIPVFQIDTTTREKALALIMLQYHSGKKAQSQINARRLLLCLNQYRANDPEAYRFWSLGMVHFAIAFYANDQKAAAEILDSSFAATEAYWLHDKSSMSVVLAPWRDHPLVIRYLQRIDTDAERARLKFRLY